MQNKEAIEFLQKELDDAYKRKVKIGLKYSTKYIVTLEMAIKALKQKPCDTCKHYENRCTWLPEKNPCEDCVFEEGSKFCIEYCPHDASRQMEELPSVKKLRNNQKIIDKCLGRNKEMESNNAE